MTRRALSWTWRVAAVLLLSGGLMIMDSPPARADNCDIRINPEDCQNTAWVVGSAAAVAACGAVVAACVYGAQSRPEEPAPPQPERVVTASATVAMPRPPQRTEQSEQRASEPSAPEPSEPSEQSEQSERERSDVEVEVQVAVEHTIAAVAGGWLLYPGPGHEVARLRSGGRWPWLPGTADFVEAARRAGLLMPEPVRSFHDLYAVLWPLPDQSVRRLVLIGYGRRDEFAFAGGWDQAGTGLVITSVLTPRDIGADPRIRSLARVFTRDAVADIYACGLPVGPVLPHMLADAWRVPVRTFAEPVAFYVSVQGGVVAARGAIGCAGLPGNSLTTLVPPLVHQPSPPA